MGSRVVYLGNQDISDRILNTNGVEISTGEYGQTVFADIPSITGNNSFGYWDSKNPSSPLFGVSNYDGYDISVLINDEPVLTGMIKNVKANNKVRTAEIEVLTDLQATLQKGCIYVTGDNPESPSQAALNILSLYNIPYDPSSFALSNSIYAADEIFITANLIKPEMTILAVLERICEIGLARMYSVNGVVYFDAFQVNYNPNTVYTFSDVITNLDGVTIYDDPQNELLEKEEITGYTVTTALGVVQDGITYNNKGKVIDGGPDQPIVISTLAAGTALGLRWVNYSQYKQERVTLGVPTAIAKYLPLGSAVSLEYTLGGWATIKLLVTKLDKSNPVMTLLTGVTV